MKQTTKKWLVIAVAITICAALVVMISQEFKTPPVEDVGIVTSEPTTSDVTVETPDTEDKVVVEPTKPTVPEKEETTSGDDVGTEQTIQPDTEKAEYTEEELTDPTKTPDGKDVEVPELTEEDYEKDTPPEVTPQPVAPTQPSGGLPGFDNVPNQGANTVITGESDGDINKQVGVMD